MSTPATTDDEHQRLIAQSDTLRQEIEDDVKATQPLTSELLPISSLLEHYTNDGGAAGFVRSATYLATRYTSMRKIRGDGNCFYRAFLYSLCEHLLRSLILEGQADEFERLDAFVKGSLKWSTECGYDEFTIEMFYDELVEIFEYIGASGKEMATDGSARQSRLDASLSGLRERLNVENGPSESCTWYMRVLTACEMKSNPDQYLPYVMGEDYMDVPSFCSREVEPMGRECTMVQVAALAACLGVGVAVEYMDGRMGEGGEVVRHEFGCGGDAAGGRTRVTLLYRPGHYDILY